MQIAKNTEPITKLQKCRSEWLEFDNRRFKIKKFWGGAWPCPQFASPGSATAIYRGVNSDAPRNSTECHAEFTYFSGEKWSLLGLIIETITIQQGAKATKLLVKSSKSKFRGVAEESILSDTLKILFFVNSIQNPIRMCNCRSAERSSFCGFTT